MLFFYIFDQERDKYRYTPDRIQNAGEMGLLPLYSQKYQKLLVLRGKRRMANLTAAERGASITVTCCMKATENFAPLMIIFPRKNENKLLTKMALCESFGTYHPSGWIRTPPFTQRFVNFIRPSEESSISLISNGRYSDTRNVDVIISNNIFLIISI